MIYNVCKNFFQAENSLLEISRYQMMPRHLGKMEARTRKIPKMAWQS